MIRPEQERVRLESLAQLRQLGIDPYPAAAYPVDTHAGPLSAAFEAGREVCLAGRILSRRIMGKASFAELQDATGKIQIYLNRDELCPDEDKTMYNTVFKKLLDRGDIVGVKGSTITTQTGESSVGEGAHCMEQVHPSFGQDGRGRAGARCVYRPEPRYRMRCVDLVVNPEVKRTFEARSRVIQVMRDAFTEKGWLEVDTPVLQAIPGGAVAVRSSRITTRSTSSTCGSPTSASTPYRRLHGVFEFSRNFRNEGMTGRTIRSLPSSSCTSPTRTTIG